MVAGQKMVLGRIRARRIVTVHVAAQSDVTKRCGASDVARRLRTVTGLADMGVTTVDRFVDRRIR
jgi:hypothetical protein